MSVNITVGNEADTQKNNVEEQPSQQPQETSTSIKLDIRKSVDGNIIILDHEDIDIVIVPSESKIITFPSDMMEDKVYDTQNHLFKILSKKGLIELGTVHSGNIYGSLEGQIAQPEDENVNPIDLTILAVARWLDDERPHFIYQKKRKKQMKDRMTDPAAEDSTPMGKVGAHKDKTTTPFANVFTGTQQKPY